MIFDWCDFLWWINSFINCFCISSSTSLVAVAVSARICGLFNFVRIFDNSTIESSYCTIDDVYYSHPERHMLQATVIERATNGEWQYISTPIDFNFESCFINFYANIQYYDDSTYIIAFIWSLDGEKMIDIWKFNDNHVDDRSGPLSDGRVYREGKLCTDMGLASGNTLLVLGHEEKLRRQSKNLKSYLTGPVPKLPLEIVNGKNFFSD